VGDERGTLKDRLATEMRAAMKERDAVRLATLRLLTAAVKNREVELRHPLSDEEFMQVATREVNRRREAIEAYEKAGREDRASTERAEQQVLESYLPEPPSKEELGALIEEALRATGATSAGDLGRVMGYVMGKAKGRVDGKAVQARVRERLDQTV
jgi:uncharacterized protein YqeY